MRFEKPHNLGRVAVHGGYRPKLGFNVGYSYSQSTTTSTTFGGTVGYLPSAYYSDDEYKYGSTLFVYPYQNTFTGHTYWVLDYAVDEN